MHSKSLCWVKDARHKGVYIVPGCGTKKTPNKQKRVPAYLGDTVRAVSDHHLWNAVKQNTIKRIVLVYIPNDSIYIKNSRKCKSLYDDKVGKWLPGTKGEGKDGLQWDKESFGRW